jgi:hypothetical protein
MRPGTRKIVGITLVASGVLTLGALGRPSRGDEPGRLGRLFRFGSSSTSSSPSPVDPPSTFGASTTTTPNVLPPFSAPPSSTASPTNDSPAPPRLVPQPRNSRPATEADPLLTRISIGRGDNGTRFGMFLQIYTDGTVLDSEGVHHVHRDALKPLIDAINASDAYRRRGHCGAPATDFIEQVYVTVFERNFGRLRANSFSYSGNIQGCDHTIKHLQDAIDAIQNKIAGPPVAAPMMPAPLNTLPAPPRSPRSIPLTPLN